MKKITYDIEWRLEGSHWWFVGRRKLLRSLLTSIEIPANAQCIDIGCGVGSNLGLFQSLGFQMVGVDSEIYSLLYARKRFPTLALVSGDLLKLPLRPNSIDLIIGTDILEHLAEDALGIKEIHRALKKGGKVLFTVPAFNFLWGIQDVVGRHKRRHSKRGLIRQVERQGFEVLRSSYFNFFLFFPILIVRRFVRLLGLKIGSENQVNSPLINFLFTRLFSLEPHLLKYLKFPFGVSIFCIAQK
jgi:SAM-dependent methyltransferase